MTTRRNMDAEVLDTLKERIDHALKNKQLKMGERLNLEVLQLVIVYMKIDHPRTERMYATFVPLAWVMVTATATLIIAAVNGRLPEIVGAVFGIRP